MIVADSTKAFLYRSIVLCAGLVALVIVSLGCSSAPTQAEVPQTETSYWSRQPAGLDAAKASEKEEEFLFDLSFPMIVSVVDYSGQQRVISSAKRTFFSHLEEAVPGIEPFIALYEHEILVSEGAERMWLPIQEQVLERLQDEVGTFGTLVVYVRFAGLAPGEEPVFFIIDFIDHSDLPGMPQSTNGFI